MIALGFAERLAGGHHPPGRASRDQSFWLELEASPARIAATTTWQVDGLAGAEGLACGGPVVGTVTLAEGRLLYHLRVARPGPELFIVGHKKLYLRDLYASLSMFRGSLLEAGCPVAELRLRLDLRGEWRRCLKNLRLSLAQRSQKP